MKTIKVKNNTNVNRTFYNKVLEPNEYYTIPSDKIAVWTNDVNLQKDILDGYALINDGSSDIDAYGEGLNYFKGIEHKFNSEGSLKIEIEPKLGTRKTISSHNFCDPCTWYEKSLRQVGDGYGQILSTIDAYATYQSPDGYTNWIDLTHGRQTNESNISGYEIEVSVDGSPKTEDVDYTINYEDGYVLFDPALTSSNEVKASFSISDSSCFVIAPSSGKKLRILYTEVQFGKSTAVIPSNPIRFQVWVYNPYDLPNKVPYGPSELYKTEMDLLNTSNGGHYINRFGNLIEDIIILPFNYAAVTDLRSSQGVEIRISIDADRPLDGYYATMTAYGLSEDDI